EERGRMKLDVSIGILYTATMALAILFIGLMKTYNAEVYGYLFGSVLSVSSDELRVIGGLAILVLGLILIFSKELYFIAFDQEMADASGIPARAIFFLLLTLVALTVVVSLKTVGAILVFAMILIPASTAYQLTHSLMTLTLYSVIIGTTTSVAGVLISAFWTCLLGLPSCCLRPRCFSSQSCSLPKNSNVPPPPMPTDTTPLTA
ncbi:MAG: metal ABC transporter permease, partial [Nitrospira sp.]|nr:metal ABC transporter permease [Nitrospira sp.]